MAEKTVFIHANKLFFQAAVPNFYEWLAQQVGVAEEFKALHEQYEQARSHGPSQLESIFNLVTRDVTIESFKEYCHTYWHTFHNKDSVARLKTARNDYKYMVVVTSYPAYVYDTILDDETINEVFGAQPIITENKIAGLAEITLQDIQIVRNKLTGLGLLNKMSLQPDRYGLLAQTIDFIEQHMIPKQKIIVVGNGTTAQPLHKLAQKVLTDFTEL